MRLLGLFNMSIYAKDMVFRALTYQRQKEKVIINRTEGGLVPHTALPIEEDFISLTDAQTKETLATFRAYGTSGGGWLATYTWVGINGSSPMFIHSKCFYYQGEYANNQISIVE